MDEEVQTANNCTLQNFDFGKKSIILVFAFPFYGMDADLSHDCTLFLVLVLALVLHLNLSAKHNK